MGSRIELHNILKAIMESNNVYFQPPPSFVMKYPCIRYERSNINTEFANNYPYKLRNRYTITVIDADPDSLTPEKVAKLPECIFDRHFKADNLNHDVFNIYF